MYSECLWWKQQQFQLMTKHSVTSAKTKRTTLKHAITFDYTLLTTDAETSSTFSRKFSLRRASQFKKRTRAVLTYLWTILTARHVYRKRIRALFVNNLSHVLTVGGTKTKILLQECCLRSVPLPPPSSTLPSNFWVVGDITFKFRTRHKSLLLDRAVWNSSTSSRAVESCFRFWIFQGRMTAIFSIFASSQMFPHTKILKKLSRRVAKSTPIVNFPPKLHDFV